MIAFMYCQTMFLINEVIAQENREVSTREFHGMVQQKIEDTIIQLTLIAVVVVIGVYAILKIRRYFLKPAIETDDVRLNNFRKLYDEGKISKEEYRSIKLLLADNLTGTETDLSVHRSISEKETRKTEVPREVILKKLLKTDDEIRRN